MLEIVFWVALSFILFSSLKNLYKKTPWAEKEKIEKEIKQISLHTQSNLLPKVEALLKKRIKKAEVMKRNNDPGSALKLLGIKREKEILVKDLEELKKGLEDVCETVDLYSKLEDKYKYETPNFRYLLVQNWRDYIVSALSYYDDDWKKDAYIDAENIWKEKNKEKDSMEKIREKLRNLK